MSVMEQNLDFTVANHGSIVILNAQSEAAQEWVLEHIDPEARAWGRSGVVVEPRYIADIVEGIVNDGLSVGEF